MADIIWTISQLERTAADGGVITAHWRCKAVDNSGDESVMTSSYGSCSFEPDTSAEDFIPFDQLTEEIVLGWVYDVIDKSAMEAIALEKLDKVVNPSQVAGLPW